MSGRFLRVGAVLMMLMLLLTACKKQEEPTTPRYAIWEMDVHDVLVTVLESQPVQVRARVTGVLGDGCTELNKVAQARQGNRVTVKVTAKRDLDLICAQHIQRFDETITLEGTYPPGEYTLAVNGLNRSFAIR